MPRQAILLFSIIGALIAPLAAAFAADELKPQPRLLESLESEDGLKAFSAGAAKMERVRERATDGQWSLKVFFPGAEKDTWPGVFYVLPVQDVSKYDMLSFDVYNPAEKPLEFAVRVDDADKQSQFIMLKLKAKAVTTVDIWVKGLAPTVDPARIVRIYPYRSKPKEDATLYLDNFRLGFALDRFKEIRFVEDAAMPPLSDADRRRGYVLFRRHYMDYVMPATVPRAEELNPRLDLFAAQGEYEPAAFGVRALKDLKQASVTVSDLNDPGGHCIRSGQVEVRVLRWLKKRTYYPSFEYLLTPTYLEAAGPLDILADTSQCFWLTVRVPKDAAPGRYEGEVTFAVQGQAASKIPLRLRVLPFALEEVRSIAYGPYYRPWNLRRLKTDDEKRAFLRRDMRDMRDHGMTSLGSCSGFDIAKITIKDGKVDLGLDGSSELELVMDAYRDLGFPEPILVLSDTAQSFAASRHPLDSEDFEREYKLVMAAINAEGRKRRWPEIIQQPVDEPVWQSQEAMDRNVRCLKILKQIPGQRTEQDGPGDKYFHEIAGPFADVWNYNGAYAPPAVIKKAKQDGHIIWIYNNDVEGFRPEMQRYAAGFHLAATGSDGVFNWEYRGGGGDLYDDFDSAHGDFVMNYLPNDRSAGGPSIGWEGFREGIDDQKYIALLRRTVDECRRTAKPQARAAAKRAEEVLDGILASLDYKPNLRATSKWDSASIDPQGGKQVRGRYKIPNGWEMSEYDVNRWRIAQAVVEMKYRLKDLPRDVARPKVPASKGGSVSVLSMTVSDQAPSARTPAALRSDRPVLSVAQTADPVRVDGKLDERVWQRPPDIAGFVTSDGKSAPSQQTQVWVAFDAVNLYVAARCIEKSMDKLVANVREDLGNVWSDDCFEIFVDAARERKSFFQVAVNSLGYKYLSLVAERARASKVRTAADVGKEAWTCETSIPLEELGALGSEMGFNVCRERRAGGSVELSCWSPTLDGFAKPERFGDLVLGAKYLKSVRVADLYAGVNEALVVLRNDGAAKADFVVEGMWVEMPQGRKAAGPREEAKDLAALFSKPEKSRSEPVALEPGKEAETRLPFRIPHGDQGGILEVSVRQLPALNEVASRRTAVFVPPVMDIRTRPRILYASDDRLAVAMTLNIAPETLKEAVLEVGLEDLFPRRLKRVEGLDGRQVVLLLDVSGLRAGTHRLYARLTGGGLRKIIGVAAKTQFEKVQGPMD